MTTVNPKVTVLGGTLSVSDAAVYDEKSIPSLPDGFAQALIGVNRVNPVTGAVSAQEGAKLKQAVVEKTEKVLLLAGRSKLRSGGPIGKILINGLKTLRRCLIVTDGEPEEEVLRQLESGGLNCTWPGGQVGTRWDPPVG